MVASTPMPRLSPASIPPITQMPSTSGRITARSTIPDASSVSPGGRLAMVSTVGHGPNPAMASCGRRLGVSGFSTVRLTTGLTWVLAVALLSCSSDSAPRPGAEGATTTGAPATTTTIASTSTVSSTTTTTVAPPLDRDGEARALVTDTGVTVPVLATLPEGLVVRTPCRDLALVRSGRAVDRVHVVLDPGHGGSEPGAVGADGRTEASINLRVAEIAAAKLRALGFDVLLTRTADVRMPIVTRVEIADTLGADLLISVHHQGGGELPVGPIPGTEVYYQRESAESRRFAGLLYEEAVEELSPFADEWYGGPDAGATYRLDSRTGDDFYGMVRRPRGTAVLAEMSFMGNPTELELLATRTFLVAEAQAIADAVVRWYADETGSGHVEPSFTLTSSGGGGGLAGCEDPDLGDVGELPADFDPAVVGAVDDSG